MAVRLRVSVPGIYVLLTSFIALGQAASTTSTPAGVQPSTAPRSNWSHTETVRASVGWRDNVLLSPFAPIASSFGRAEVETFVLWKKRDWQFVSFVNGDVLRYFAPPDEVSGEQTWFGHAEVRWQHWPAWRMALKADAFLQDAVIDLSETESIRTIARTRVHGGFATTATRITLPGGFAVEPIAQVKRTDYRTFTGDYEETRIGGRAEWKRRAWLGLSVAWFEHQRDYDDREKYTAGGRARPGTRLQFWQQIGEVKATAAWTARGAWTAALTAGRLENRDRSSGFFDYDQKRGRVELDWQGARWKVALDGEAKRLDYLLQTVGTGTNPPPRIADYFETSVQIDRELNADWTVFLQHRWERSRSNEIGFSYRANTVLAGVQRIF